MYVDFSNQIPLCAMYAQSNTTKCNTVYVVVLTNLFKINCDEALSL